MSKCYACGDEIDDSNCTEEHIFLNAIGGHLSSKDLICRTCNSDFGLDIDTELANQFKNIATMLNIKRDRGKVQPFDVVDSQDNTVYSIGPGGKPVQKIPIIKNDGNHYTIKVANKRQAKKVLLGFKRKCPDLDVDGIVNKSHTEKEYLNNMVKFKISFGGEKAFRALCKTAVNYYLYKGGKREYISHLVSYINGAEDMDIVWPTYLDGFPIATKKDEVLHSIIVRGDIERRRLFAYIELFDFYKVVVMLNDNYDGEPIEYSYFYDVLSCEEVERKYNIDNVLCNKFSHKDMMKKLQSCLSVVIEKAMERQEKDHISELLDMAIKNAKEQINGKDLSEDDMSNIMTNEVMKQITPWIQHIFQ